ncbi:MAG TPA: response regulator, partial [Bacteroidales bacterium]|nr:response regulator [Bacteroidales bacterium]
MPDTLLIIDDEIQIRRLLEITLTANGYKIIKAGSGNEGLVAAASHQPACILLDLGLPDYDGLLILKQLRSWYTKPILIISVKSSEEDVIKALDMGA